MQVSQAGLKLIAEFEGFSAYLYNDPVGHATVAYGILVHTGNYHEQRGVCAGCDQWPRKSERDKWLTYEQGRQLLAEKVKPYAAAVERLSRPLQQQEFDALTSLCYNIGQGGYERSGVRKAVNSNGDVCAALRLIVKGTDGVTYPGLVRRREAECKMFYGPAPEDEPMTPAERAEMDKLRADVEAQRKELLTLGILLATGREAEAEARIRYMATAGNIPLP